VTQIVSAPALEMRGITKRYPGVVANDRIDLEIRPGEVHALLGENGAGKSTLMNILYGLATPDEGEILLDGETVLIAGPSDAIRRGISMVHQHFMLVPVLSVADNILLGEETMANPIFLDRREAHRRIVELGQRFGFEIDPEKKVESLSVGWQQRVEILKALYREARILVLDEPTAVLTPQETKEIFAVLRRLAEEGHSIIFISHKLYEVLEIADRITVIRRGKVVGERIPSETNEEDLAELMVGRNVQLVVDRGESHPAGPALVVSDLRVADDRGHEAVKGVDFEVRAGEILGVAGVAGNGQEELVEALTGLRRPTTGRVQLGGTDVTGAGPRQLQKAGMSFVPGDRHRFGLVLSFPLEDNLVLTQYDEAPYARGLLRNDKAIEEWAIRAIEQYDIRTPSASVTAGTLSGGNQQKAVVAREFSREVTALVLDQPTRGLDVGSIEFIHRQVVAKRDTGAAILLVSAELDEVLELSDRVAVMYRGEIVALVDGPTAEREEIGLLMATGRRPTPGAAVDEVPIETIRMDADEDAR
jgi:simple sugar transport system ATP-binding protein